MNKMTKCRLSALLFLLSMGFIHAMNPVTFDDAIEAGDLAAVERYIKDDPSLVNRVKDDRTILPLAMACRAGHEDIVGLLIDSGASVNPNDDITPLRCTVLDNNIAIGRLLLDHGASVDRRDKLFGETPLHQAVSGGKVEFVQLLLEYGALVDLKNFAGQTPLDLARHFRDETIANLLQQSQQTLQQNLAGQSAFRGILQRRKGAQSSAE